MASQSDRIAGGEIYGVKVRRPRADRDLLHVWTVSGQDGRADGQATHDQANQQPGTSHGAKPEPHIAASARGPPERDRRTSKYGGTCHEGISAGAPCLSDGLDGDAAVYFSEALLPR